MKFITIILKNVSSIWFIFNKIQKIIFIYVIYFLILIRKEFYLFLN